MKRKIRVVSIILCTAIILGLLPAEQVFAASSGNMMDIFGLNNCDWYVGLSTDNNGKSASTADNFKGEISGVNFSFDVDNKKDHTPGNAMASFPFSTSEMEEAGNCVHAEKIYRQSIVGTAMLNLPTGKNHNLTPEEFDRSIGILEPEDSNCTISSYLNNVSNVYTHDFFWSSQNNSEDVQGSTDDNWFWQRVICNYSPEYDKFFYISISIVSNSKNGANYKDVVYITGKESNMLTFYGLVSEYKDGDKYASTFEDYCEEVCEKVELWYKEEVLLPRESLGGLNYIENAILRYGEVSLYSGDKSGFVNTDAAYDIWSYSEDLDEDAAAWVTASDINTAALRMALMQKGTPGVSTEINGRYADVDWDSAIMRLFKIRTNGEDAFKVELNVEIDIVDVAVRTEGLVNDVESVDSKVNTSDFNSKKDDLEDIVSAKDIVIENFELKDCSFDIGVQYTKDIDEGKIGFFENLSLDTFGYLMAIDQTSDCFLFDSWSAAGVTELLEGFSGVIDAMKAKTMEVHIASDTGDKIANYISSLVDTSGSIKVSVDVGNNYLDWKKLETGAITEIPAGSLADVYYIIAFVKYMYDNNRLPVNFSNVYLTDNSRRIILYYNSDIIEPGYLCQWYTDDFHATNKEADDCTTYLMLAKDLLSGNRLHYDDNDGQIFIADSYGVDAETAYLTSIRIAQAYKRTTEDSLFERGIENFGLKDNVLSSLTASQSEEVDLTIQEMEGVFTYNGSSVNSLAFSYANLLYAVADSTAGVKDGGLYQFNTSMPFMMFTKNCYSRVTALKGSEFGETVLDYMPRLPLIKGNLNKDILNLLYNVEYGLAVLDWSAYATEKESSPEDIEAWFKDDSKSLGIVTTLLKDVGSDANMTALQWAELGVYDDLPDNYLNFFRIIINTQKVCAYLAVLNGDITIEELELSFEYRPDKEVEESVTNAYNAVKTATKTLAENWSIPVSKFVNMYYEEEDFFIVVSQNLINYVGGEFSYSTPIEPLGFVIKFEDEQMSAQWKYGYALSSMYVPFKTNIYEVASIEEKANDSEWVTNFYYKYGFYRKALYITTDPDAVVDRYVNGTQSGTKVATLRDLLNYNRDIELYVDQSFYNSALLEQQLDRYIQNTNEGSVFGSMFDACNLTPDSILKTGGYATYSSAIQGKVRPFGYEIADAEKEEAAKMFEYEDFILSEDDVLGEDGMLSAYEYSIQQPYGLVSAVYRSGTLFDTANRASTQNKPVFVSSKNANAIGEHNKDLYRCFYNYLMLSAMEETIEKETTLLVDYDAPIFIDIFGNIVTADGYVIIPAAANPTLTGSNWSPYSLGFATYVNNAEPGVFEGMTYEFYDFLYGINYAAAIGKSDVDTYSSNFRDNQKKIGGGYFYLRQDGTSTLGTTNLTDGVASTTVTWDNPNTRVAALKKLLFSVHYLNTADIYSMTTVNLVLEVLRGAPIEFIDLEAEGISTTRALTKGGATIAYMSEKLMNSIQTDSNGTERSAKFSATLNVLDLFHIESAEKIALLAVKLLLIGFLILLAVQIVADASVGKMPTRTVGRIIVTCVLTGTCISLLPVLTEFSLAKLTQMMLQQEAAELLAMQAQRDSYGVEIGITESYNTKSSTDIIVKVGELDVQWYDLLLYSVYSSIDNSFRDLYIDAADGLPLAEASYTFTSGKNIYMDLGKVMDSTVVQYNGELGILTNERLSESSEEDLSASYLFPYYVFLDQLIANVNMYNQKNGVQPLTYNINSDGSIRTQDMTYAYFHSPEFFTTDYDVLDLYRILGTNTPKLSYCNYFSDKEIVTMSGSLWFPETRDSDSIEKSIDTLYQKAREYIANNSDMLSYVSDGAFLKSFAMYLAVEYNSIFGVGIADAFELKCVDTKDMLRYVVSEPKDVYKYATRSFSRYAFEASDIAGVLLATTLFAIMCVTNAIKVVAYVLTYVTAIGSIIYHRVFKHEEDYSVYGFFILIGEITILNVIYSASLKVMMNLTRWGVPGIGALVISIVLQGLIIVGFIALCFNGVKNVKMLGQHEIHSIHNVINNFSRDRSRQTVNPPAGEPERTVAVLQAHDFTRRENDNFNGDRANVADLMAHDRRRESGQIGQEETAIS